MEKHGCGERNTFPLKSTVELDQSLRPCPLIDFVRCPSICSPYIRPDIQSPLLLLSARLDEGADHALFLPGGNLGDGRALPGSRKIYSW